MSWMTRGFWLKKKWDARLCFSNSDTPHVIIIVLQERVVNFLLETYRGFRISLRSQLDNLNRVSDAFSLAF